MTRVLLATLTALLLCCGSTHAQQQSWSFRVLLDGKPIGVHRFQLSTQDKQQVLTSNAAFAVRLLGITIYRYRHLAIEHWQGDCLRSLNSNTDDGGEHLEVTLQPADLPECVMSYAYWNPRMLQQTRLINAQTGRVDAIQASPAGTADIEVRGKRIAASRWRVAGPRHPIDLWYANDQTGTGAWLGLDSNLGERILSYRLE
jgi:Domain of unknown function (DUF6134)